VLGEPALVAGLPARDAQRVAFLADTGPRKKRRRRRRRQDAGAETPEQA
jgi:hypothetical protein